MSERPPHDIYVVSDLHMGRGMNPATRRFHRLETFFFDADFRSFASWACASSGDRGLLLVLNGDVFDLLRVEPEDAPLTQGSFTPDTAARIVTEILDGHSAFVDGLVEILLAGGRIVQLPGNHDNEIQWAPVQEAIRRALRSRAAARAGEEGAERALGRYSFAPWFVYEPGRIWVEHGCQYDPENAYRYPLRSTLPASPHGLDEAELDMPLGNFVQRYLYNHFGSITFIVPSASAHVRYFKWLVMNKPGTLIRVVSRHVPFGFRVVRRLAKAATSAKGDIRHAHEEELARLATESGLGDKLREIDARKVPGADAVNAVRALSGQILRGGAVMAGTVLLLTVLRSGGHSAAGALRAGVGTQALVAAAIDLALIAVLASLALWALLRVPREHAPRPLRKGAQAVARILDVPVVTFGHSHEEFVAPLDRPSGKAWYFNTGTWISVFTHDVFLPRERVQFTFLRVRGDDAELLHWSPGREEALPVVLVEERASDLPAMSAPA